MISSIRIQKHVLQRITKVHCHFDLTKHVLLSHIQVLSIFPLTLQLWRMISWWQLHISTSTTTIASTKHLNTIKIQVIIAYFHCTVICSTMQISCHFFDAVSLNCNVVGLRSSFICFLDKFTFVEMFKVVLMEWNVN